jgi:hypothetical protein
VEWLVEAAAVRTDRGAARSEALIALLAHLAERDRMRRTA